MPVGELVAEVVGGVARLLGHLVSEFVVELLIRGVGYAIWRRVSPRTEPDGWPSAVVGFLFWAALFTLGSLAFTHGSVWLAVDDCLDSGGAYDHQAARCMRGWRQT